MCFWAVEDHYNLQRPLEGKASQLTFEANKHGVRCLVYREDTCTKSHNGDLHDMKYDRRGLDIST